MSRYIIHVVLLMSLIVCGTTSAGSTGGTYDYDMDGDGTLTYPNSGWISMHSYDINTSSTSRTTHELYYIRYSDFTLYVEGYGTMESSHPAAAVGHNNRVMGYTGGSLYEVPDGFSFTDSYSGSISGSGTVTRAGVGQRSALIHQHSNVRYTYPPDDPSTMYSYLNVYISPYPIDVYTVSGALECIDSVYLYIYINGTYTYSAVTSDNPYSFGIVDGESYRLVFSDGTYYDFVCDGNEVFDYDGCIYVYGYTCGIDNIRLYKDDGGWVLQESEAQGASYNVYEIRIEEGEDYLISFTERGFVMGNQTFSCTGDHVLIDYDRCNWVYPPNGDPYIIYLWAGYDYNIVVMKDAHGNFIENSQIAIYDKTDNTHIHKWTGSDDGYMLLGAKFATDHDVQISVRTFDGIFTLDTVFPANGTSQIGEEDITTTNWTIPIMYNLGLQPVDQNDKPLFDVFCGLVEYTPLNPLSFWGMDLSDRGYVPVTNCSGFAMCDIVAEKDGYTDYNVSMINWTSRSAMVKDYRHNVVMEEQ